MTTTTLDPWLARLPGRRRRLGRRRTAAPDAPAGPVARRRHNSMFLGIAFLVAVLNLLGLVMVLSASSAYALDRYGTSWYHVTRQATWALAGTAVLILIARVDYHRWRQHAGVMLGGTVVLLAGVLVVGNSHRGASRWIGFGALTFQPGELVKLTFIVWVADLLARRVKQMHNTRATLRPVIVGLAVIGGLMMLQPNLGTTIVVTGIALAMCFVAGVPLAPFVRWAGLGIGLATVLAVAAPYRRARVLSFLNPMADPQGENYQSVQSLVGLASGGFAGSGLGGSRAKFGFLPYAHSDFIFAIIGEELGLVGALVVVALFVLFGILGIRIALHAPDRFGMLIAVGITAWFMFQAFVNISVVAGVLPVTGVPLPFVSYGGSSLIFSMGAAGLLLAVARKAVTPGSRAPAGAPTDGDERDGAGAGPRDRGPDAEFEGALT
jgi:cell division protein FtsW